MVLQALCLTLKHLQQSLSYLQLSVFCRSHALICYATFSDFKIFLTEMMSGFTPVNIAYLFLYVVHSPFWQ
jgi:hypothetical protein